MHVTYKEIFLDHPRDFGAGALRIPCDSFWGPWEVLRGAACKPRCGGGVPASRGDKISQLYVSSTPDSSEPSARISLSNPLQKDDQRPN